MNAKAVKKAEKKKNTDDLIKALDDSDLEIRGLAADALDHLGWKPSDIRENIDYLIAKGQIEKCGELGEAAIGPLIDKLERDIVVASAFGSVIIKKTGKDRFRSSGFELTPGFEISLILIRSGVGQAVNALKKYAAIPGSVKNELIGFLLQLRQKSGEYSDLTDGQAHLHEMYDELERAPFDPSAWGSSGSYAIYKIGDELAQKVEWVNEHAYQLLIYLCNYALDFKKCIRNDVYRTLYACNGYLSEFGDPEFVVPLIALMLAAYIAGDSDIAAHCGVLLGQAGRSSLASKYVLWAKENGLIRTYRLSI